MAPSLKRNVYEVPLNIWIPEKQGCYRGIPFDMFYIVIDSLHCAFSQVSHWRESESLLPFCLGLVTGTLSLTRMRVMSKWCHIHQSSILPPVELTDNDLQRK